MRGKLSCHTLTKRVPVWKILAPETSVLETLPLTFGSLEGNDVPRLLFNFAAVPFLQRCSTFGDVRISSKALI